MTVTVKDLIEELKKVEQDRIVIMSSDPEGNNYSPIYCISKAAYNKEYREIGMEELTEEDREQGYTEEDVMEDGKKAVVFYPSN